jgi:molybdate transport system ATP-binding protein
MPETILKVEGLSVSLSGRRLLEDVYFQMRDGDCLAVAGASGSGKTLLLQALAGRVMHGGTVTYENGRTNPPRIAFVPRHHRFWNRSNLSSFYHQQRFKSFDSTDAPAATEELLNAGASAERIASTLADFGIDHLRDEPLIRFSNGEHRRFQLAKAVLADPEWILIDDPLAGLDKEARVLFERLVHDLAASGKRLVFATGTGEPPTAVTRVLWMQEGGLRAEMTREAYYEFQKAHRPPVHLLPDPDLLDRMAALHADEPFENTVHME